MREKDLWKDVWNETFLLCLLKVYWWTFVSFACLSTAPCDEDVFHDKCRYFWSCFSWNPSQSPTPHPNPLDLLLTGVFAFTLKHRFAFKLFPLIVIQPELEVIYSAHFITLGRSVQRTSVIIFPHVTEWVWWCKKSLGNSFAFQIKNLEWKIDDLTFLFHRQCKRKPTTLNCSWEFPWKCYER